MVVGSKNQREIKKIKPIVSKIKQFEESYQSEPDSFIQSKTEEWQSYLHRYLPLESLSKAQLKHASKEQIQEAATIIQYRFDALKTTFPAFDITIEPTAQSIEKAKEIFSQHEEKFHQDRQKYLNTILPEAYALVKNAARRLNGQTFHILDQDMTWDMVHFDVQLIGGIALHQGMIAEMQTGEGKTLVATLPVYLNALTGLGVHVVTVNDYLARRDSEWMGVLFKYLGLTIGCLQNQMAHEQKQAVYQSDIIYGTNSEFGFDYLRDNGMATSSREQVQREHYFAIIDEVDSILIDEARTPLIISGPSLVAQEHQYEQFKPMVDRLVRKQKQLCQSYVKDIKELLEKDEETAGKLLYKLQLASPSSPELLQLLEDPNTRRLLERSELSLLEDPKKKALFALKEDLYFIIDEKSNDADLMEKGREFLSPNQPESFVMPDLATSFSEIDGDNTLNTEEKQAKKEVLQTELEKQSLKIHNISQLLKAYSIYQKDVDYVVRDNQVVIVDENTGREMPGRRWSDGLHQAVEAKEGVKIEEETQTYATITIQNYFRLYQKLAGMTGTAETEAAEFHDIYDLDVLPIPTNRDVLRIDKNDQVYKTQREKNIALLKTINECYAKGQPMLIGTASVEASEMVSRMLKQNKIIHSVLNAKYHRQEAEIISRAGQKGAITVSTNMAGRGTDIKLGEGVAELGGLMVIGTERHESRRVDRQLRGRCARQGDPGSTQFFISFEDSLMRNFAAADKMTAMLERLGLEEGESLEHPWLNKSVETAQKRVEQLHYRRRKYVLDFDDVMNQQREVVYGLRQEVLNTEDTSGLLDELITEGLESKVADFISDADISGLVEWYKLYFPSIITEEEISDLGSASAVTQFLLEKIKEIYALKVQHEQPELLSQLESHIMLVAIDRQWQSHLYQMDALREGVQLRAQGQKDPLVEYKNEAYKLFSSLMQTINEEILSNLFRSSTSLENFEKFLKALPTNQSSDATITSSSSASSTNQTNTNSEAKESGDIQLNYEKRVPYRRTEAKIGRNEPCPCKSGKKYKHCCGAEK